MKKRITRFQKLELFPLLGVFKKPKTELKRFECLEVNGHKIQLKITEEVKKYITCPKCQRNNPKGSLYCIYCNFIFEDIAEKTKEIELQVWETRCPGCGRKVVRTQKYCLCCGWRLVPLEKEEVLTGPSSLREKEDLLRQGEIITLTVDGKTYRSTDKIIPLDIKELMLKIKREGYSKEMIDEWIKNKNIERQERQRQRYQNLQERIESLRYEIVWRVILTVGVIILIYFLVRLRLRL